MRKSFRCSDRMCGALDCPNCNPEGIQYPKCEICENEFETCWKDDKLCEDCQKEGWVKCEICEEWALKNSFSEYTFKEGNTEMLCEECVVTATEEGQ